MRRIQVYGLEGFEFDRSEATSSGQNEVFSCQKSAQGTPVLQLFHNSQVSIEVKGCRRDSGSLFGYGKNERRHLVRRGRKVDTNLPNVE